MRLLLPIFLLLSLDCPAQLVPKIVVTVELPTAKEANDEKQRQTTELKRTKETADSLDSAAVVSIAPASEKPVVITTSLYSGKPGLLAAELFIKTNVWSKGALVIIERHNCPHTNAPPKDWLGCALDPRAENVVMKIVP